MVSWMAALQLFHVHQEDVHSFQPLGVQSRTSICWYSGFIWGTLSQMSVVVPAQNIGAGRRREGRRGEERTWVFPLSSQNQGAFLLCVSLFFYFISCLCSLQQKTYWGPRVPISGPQTVQTAMCIPDNNLIYLWSLRSLLLTNTPSFCPSTGFSQLGISLFSKRYHESWQLKARSLRTKNMVMS